ncbi:unnamed protein product [Pedinophyceae sp. YPF-701]|nr:unnamed protein product [Pedinophyceae sp. YPF-701]
MAGVTDRMLDFFAGAPAERLKGTTKGLFAVGVLTNIWIPTADPVIALLGLVCVFLASIELLNLFLIITPASILMDIIRLAVVSRPKGFALAVLLEVVLMAIKGCATYFAISLKRSLEDGYDSGGGQYQSQPTFDQGPPSADPYPYQAPSAPGGGGGGQ